MLYVHCLVVVVVASPYAFFSLHTKGCRSSHGTDPPSSVILAGLGSQESLQRRLSRRRQEFLEGFLFDLQSRSFSSSLNGLNLFDIFGNFAVGVTVSFGNLFAGQWTQCEFLVLASFLVTLLFKGLQAQGTALVGKLVVVLPSQPDTGTGETRIVAQDANVFPDLDFAKGDATAGQTALLLLLLCSGDGRNQHAIAATTVLTIGFVLVDGELMKAAGKSSSIVIIVFVTGQIVQSHVPKVTGRSVHIIERETAGLTAAADIVDFELVAVHDGFNAVHLVELMVVVLDV